MLQIIGDTNHSLLAGAVTLARSIAAKSPVALVGTKRALLHKRSVTCWSWIKNTRCKDLKVDMILLLADRQRNRISVELLNDCAQFECSVRDSSNVPRELEYSATHNAAMLVSKDLEAVMSARGKPAIFSKL